MNRNYNLKLDLQFRCNNSIMKFNQFDNNTSDFFIRITNSGKLVDVEKAIVVLAIIKPSGKVASQFVEVENGLVYADLKPNMKDEIGTYTAQAMLILEDERVVTESISYEVEEDKIFSLLNDTVEDTEDFTLLTDMLNRLSTIEISEEQRVINEAERILSEENRKIEEAKRVEAELIRQHEEADRAKYDATRESNENIRKQNESIRLANETNRIDEEAKRVEEEAKRAEAEQLRKDNYNFMTEDEERRRSEANAHKEAEKLRAQAENTRVNEEAKRRTTEQARISAENTRVSNENTRKANETTRQNNETKRVEAETQRQNRYNSFIADAEANANNFENYTNTAKVKEEERKSNELDRKSQEDRRVSNEVERISNENTRKANEKARQNNETTRQNIFENKVDEVDKKIVEINTTKDNFVSNINTKVDTKISEIDNAKSDMTNTVSNKVNEVETRFNALTSSQQQDAEVIDARDGETSLKARLDRDIEKAKQVYVNVEGSNISTDSSVGYLKDIEILGNTIQSASNLADIRSVGDKVEGQELYEIPVVSRGKNLFNKDDILLNRAINSVNGVEGASTEYHITNFIPIKPNTSYIRSLGTAIYYYDKDYKFISFLNHGINSPSNAKYCRLQLVNSWDLNTFQLEEGTQATQYEPYQEDKLTILSPVQLEKGDVLKEVGGVWGVVKNRVDISSILLKATKIKENETHCIYRVMADLNLLANNDDIISSLQKYDYETIQVNGMTGYGILKTSSNTNIIVSTPKNESIDAFVQSNKILGVTNNPQFIPLPHDQQIKLRTFASKTNISFGCEIEGTIKAQVPKSLGATVNTHTEQINNLNKELDRVKKLEESTVSTVTTESDFTTVEATSNGYFEDVKLEGKTLVNLFDYSTPFNTHWKDITISQGFKPNTKYTFIIQSSGDASSLMLGVLNTSGNWSCLKEPYDVGSSIFMLTTDSNPINTIRMGTLSPTGVEATYNKIIILEGDHTQNPPSYFEGLKSVGQDVEEVSVESVNENIMDDGDIIVGYLDGATNTYKDSTTTRSLCAKVKPNTTYTIHTPCIGDKDYNRNILGLFSEYPKVGVTFSIPKEGANIAYVNGVNQKTFTTFSDTRYVVFYFTSDINTIGASFKMQLEEGTGVTPYTPHQADKKRLLYYNEETQTWEKPILREWDSIEKHANGKYYYHQRSGEVVFDDKSTTVNCWNNNPGDVVGFYWHSHVVTNDKPKANGLVINDLLPNNVGGHYATVEGFRYTSYFAGSIHKDKLGVTDVNDATTCKSKLLEYLGKNNLTAVYQLAEEKVYECTNIDLITYANETNFIVESGVLSPRTTLKVHNNISNVVSLLQKKVSLLESNVTSYMITQNRLMLASRYNADTVSFKVDVASFSDTFEYDNDLYELILNNILVGKDNYNREYIENLIRFYWMDFVISDEMYSTLFEIIEGQHNPKIEEETPLI